MASTSGEHGTSREDFVYSPLKDATREIRVAHLAADLAVTPDGVQVPQCTLEHLDLEPPSEYLALSYAWGDAADTTTILLDGTQKQVTQNLASFLLQASSSLRGSDVKSWPFWIDALCINQSDETEKSHQVAMMGRIFKNAASMGIWLGPASEDSHLAFRLLSKLAESYTEVATFDEASSNQSVDSIVSWLDNLSGCYRGHLEALHRLVSRPWWERVWVQQEVHFAPCRQSAIFCGKDVMWWRDVVIGERTLKCLELKGRQRGPDHTNSTCMNCTQKMLPTCRYSHQQIWGNDRISAISLADHLYKNRISYHPRRASLAVDHVYTSVDVIMQPDYSRSIEEVGSALSHRASGPKLEVQGFQVDLLGDEVKLSSLFWTGMPSFDVDFKAPEWLKKYIDFIDSYLSQKNLSAGTFDDIWWRVPIASLHWSDRVTRYDQASPRVRDVFYTLLELSPMRSLVAREPIWDGPRGFGLLEYLRHVTHFSRNRMPFVSASGRIGLGPTEMKPSDKVFIILGHRVPIILRDAADGGFRIVGDAYIHGLMNGEAMERNPKIETITLL
ncbi:hypothetical protein LTR37_013580 [Vermiconidia calcicola]|uniref:Uncharacterized protein n=1 Tax=Vermiconidia calcicola TaxID=1690605 RepID=A0ACC3MW35_9PEZI|nr:hypothetical protein LTR37_013580 [Vermiconidia calcicola]